MRLFDSIPLSTLLILAPSLTSAFYLPGVAPTSYDAGDKVPLYVNHLTPAFSQQDDQLHSAFSFSYYHPAFRFCRPEGGPKKIRESLGSIIFGDRIQTSPFELFMAKNESCKAVCSDTKKFDPRSAKFVNRKISQTFNINWLVDGLPAAHRSEDPLTKEIFYSPGFFLGGVGDNGVPYLNNHYDIIIDYHRAGLRNDQYRVVGVLVQPRSVRDSKNLGDGTAECGNKDSPPLILDVDGETSVTWTYGVYWMESSTTWATRWDNYLHVFDPKIHWFSLINSSIFVVFLSGMVSMILLRALRKDIARYNRLDSFNLDDLSGTNGGVEDGVQEDSGWKLVHGDVFRCPKHPLVLSVFLGNGAQLFVMTGLTVGMPAPFLHHAFPD
jgi:transmembrane 9 superfamily protein 2/4